MTCYEARTKFSNDILPKLANDDGVVSIQEVVSAWKEFLDKSIADGLVSTDSYRWCIPACNGARLKDFHDIPR